MLPYFSSARRLYSAGILRRPLSSSRVKCEPRNINSGAQAPGAKLVRRGGKPEKPRQPGAICRFQCVFGRLNQFALEAPKVAHKVPQISTLYHSCIRSLYPFATLSSGKVAYFLLFLVEFLQVRGAPMNCGTSYTTYNILWYPITPFLGVSELNFPTTD